MKQSGAATERLWWVIIAAILLVFSFALNSCSTLVSASPEATATPVPPDANNIRVNVTNLDGAPLLKGVVIRVTNSTESDGDDHDSLTLGSCSVGQSIAVWAPGYHMGFIPCDGSTSAYSIALPPLQSDSLPQYNLQDNPNYYFLSAYGNCNQCHDGRYGDGYNELHEWELSAHARVFKDPYFESMYRGTDIYGAKGAVTNWEFKGNGLVRNPDLSKGPGFQLDYPDQAGNCAYCHAPAAIVSSRAGVNIASMNFAAGDSRSEGITCDVCHKVNNVILDDSGYPFTDKPGILSLQLLRMNDLTIGPFANIILADQNIAGNFLPRNGQSICSSVFSSSELCAACHFGKFGDVMIYNSYGEWRDSSYAKNPQGDGYRTCQDCHMSQHGDTQVPFSKRSACSETDPSFQNFNHNMMDFGYDEKLGRNIPRLVRGAAKVKVEFEYKPEELNSVQVHVIVRNTSAGHNFPTDSPLRHLILVVDARDQFMNVLPQVDGPQIPNWGGVYNAFMDASGVKPYAGLPGTIFANLLVEEDINLWPSAAYWNETKPASIKKNKVLSDNRLKPGGKDVSDYFFSVADDGEIRLTVSLIYRFAFYDLMLQKRWADSQERRDIPVTVVQCTGNVRQLDQIDCHQIDP